MPLLVVTLTSLLFAVGAVCMPLSDQGPHLAHGWGQVVRLRHLYAARPGLHLLISGDGQIHGSADQTLYSLLEIRPVDPGCVVIRGAATARFLCMEEDGRLYSSNQDQRWRTSVNRTRIRGGEHLLTEPGSEPTYSREDCTFREHVLPDGYNTYVSDRHRALLSLGNQRQRLQSSDRGVPALARFLPRISTLAQTSFPGPDLRDRPSAAQTEEPVDAMDSFGKLSQIIHSPSFHKR
ncbi:fibroblast growth factor 19 isoform X1 [Embiotoca jacksoni]|uniref:fibroblast growth factor 19 isoform X1 n=1 Tax=Embiotoca jacksoni TaxID=100190 RepID=UPI00370377CB